MEQHNHRTLSRQIDALDEAKTVSDLVAKLKPILHTLGYYATMSDGAVIESHEEWHEGVTDMLYSGTNEDYTAAPVAQRAPPPVAQPKPKKKPLRADDVVRTPTFVAREAPKNRPPRGNVPPSLLAIMQGTHDTLREE
ncbi:MAG: hypothetical protein WC700_07735 [Gemmatimonadaceae bacterium]|jgi:hypothetical protein